MVGGGWWMAVSTQQPWLCLHPCHTLPSSSGPFACFWYPWPSSSPTTIFLGLGLDLKMDHLIAPLFEYTKSYMSPQDLLRSTRARYVCINMRAQSEENRIIEFCRIEGTHASHEAVERQKNPNGAYGEHCSSETSRALKSEPLITFQLSKCTQ